MPKRPPETERRRRAERWGRWAEFLCRLALRLKGYRVLETRLRTPAGEIDILAERAGVLAIVEVKARPDLETGLASVGLAARRRLMRAAGLYVGGRRRLSRHALRLDLMVVRPGRWPLHLADAWPPPDP